MKLFNEQGLLREPVAAGGDGGGGAAVSLEDVNKAINGAVAKLKTEITGQFTTMLKPFEGLGDQLTQLTTNLTEVQTKLTAAPAAGGDDKNKGKATDPEVAAMLKKLEASQATLTTQLAAEKEKREGAEKAAQKSTKDAGLQAALNKFQFANEQAAEDAFSLLAGQVEFGEDGKLVAGGLPLNDFVADFIPNKKSYLLAPAQKGGAGASAGQGRGGGANVQFESIKAGMSIEDQRAAAGAILRAMPSQG